PVIAGERLGQRPDTAEPVGDGVGQQLRVAEGVADALAGDRVEQQSGVTDQGPAGTVGLTQVAGQIRGAAETLRPAPGPDPLAQAHRVEGTQDVALDVAAEFVEPGRRPGQVGQQQAVVGRPGADGAARPAVDLAGPG